MLNGCYIVGAEVHVLIGSSTSLLSHTLFPVGTAIVQLLAVPLPNTCVAKMNSIYLLQRYCPQYLGYECLLGSGLTKAFFQVFFHHMLGGSTSTLQGALPPLLIPKLLSKY